MNTTSYWSEKRGRGGERLALFTFGGKKGKKGSPRLIWEISGACSRRRGGEKKEKRISPSSLTRT